MGRPSAAPLLGPAEPGPGPAGRADRTRERILDAAEAMFAERGIQGPSLNEINTRAGQRNKTSLQYHFGGRDGLVQAILDRHRPWFHHRTQQLYDELAAASRLDDIQGLVELHVRPIAEYVEQGHSQRHYLRIWTQVLASPGTRMEDVRYLLDEPIQTDTARRLIAIMSEQMPRELAVERLTGMMLAAVHLFADRAVVIDAPRSRRTELPLPIVTANLVDMIAAALTAPVGPAARAALRVR